jgi:hypothetical protein
VEQVDVLTATEQVLGHRHVSKLSSVNQHCS